MNVMSREECINTVNRLVEFNLITENQLIRIIEKRDKQEREHGN